MKWISVKDELPKSERVLTIDKYNFIVVSAFDPILNVWLHADDVTHWMELPEVPNEMD